MFTDVATENRAQETARETAFERIASFANSDMFDRMLNLFFYRLNEMN